MLSLRHLSPVVRLGTAALAALVVLVLPFRVGQGCEMMASTAVALHVELSDWSSTDEHHHHHSGETVPVDSPGDIPQGEPCTDLMHCVVAAVPATTAGLEPAWAGLGMRVPAKVATLVSVALPLEPPPPRA